MQSQKEIQPAALKESRRLTEFSYSDKKLTTVTINNEPWFVAKQICDILEIKGNGKDVVRRSLHPDEKLKGKVVASGQTRNMWLVNESGLYHLIFKSRKPEAIDFRKWVTMEVLPALRRSGTYTMPGRQLQLPMPKSPRRHNRLTQERLVTLLADVCRIEDAELRNRIVNQLIPARP